MTVFFPCKKFPDITLSNPTCVNVWLLDSSVLHIWIFVFSCLVFPFFFVCLLVFGLVFWARCVHLSFHFWGFSSRPFWWCLLGFCCACCFGFRWCRRRKMFTLRFWCFFCEVVGYPIWVRMLCYFELELWSPQKQGVKQQDAFFY